MAMGADYSFELIFIEAYAPHFFEHNKFFLDSVLPVGTMMNRFFLAPTTMRMPMTSAMFSKQAQTQ